jgi:hypothetical protein
MAKTLAPLSYRAGGYDMWLAVAMRIRCCTSGEIREGIESMRVSALELWI